MPSKCSIVECGATKSSNQPNLTFHRLPKNENKRRIWLEAIGKENLRENTQYIYICSLHFEEKTFNKTLGILRLKDEAVPTLFLKGIIDINRRIDPLPNYCDLRIVGGQLGDLNLLPYQVCISANISNVYTCVCGGAIIAMDYVITAAHCFKTPKAPHYSKLYIIAGSLRTHYNVSNFHATQGDGQYRKIKNLYLHKQFNYEYLRNDIAILQVNKQFIMSKKVKPVRLHTDTRQVTLRGGKNCIVSGYGVMEGGLTSRTLRMVCIPLMSKEDCYSEIYDAFLSASNFCAGKRHKDSCMGDSGGPIVCDGVAVGLVSFSGECGVQPGVYTRLLTYTAPDAPKPYYATGDHDSAAKLRMHILILLAAKVFWFYELILRLCLINF